jgi:hypothetical protein
MKKSKNIVMMRLGCYVRGVHDSCVCVRAFQQKQMGGDNPETRGKDKAGSICQGSRVTATTSVDFEAVKMFSVS